MTVYVDIDETICFHANSDASTERDYEKATPIPSNIQKINHLHAQGHKIIYWTARGSLTGINWFSLTKRQLKKWGAHYDELKVDKPYYDLFICDKAVNSNDYVS